MQLDPHNRQDVDRQNRRQDVDESDFTLLSLIPGAWLLVRLWFWLMLQWRAVRLHCARAWYHFSRGRSTRQERNRQHRSSGVIAEGSRKVRAAPFVFYQNFRDHRAWLFTTVCGTIGIILLIFLFLRSWWIPTAQAEPEITDLGTSTSEPEFLFITDESAIGDAEIKIHIESLSIVRPPLNEQFVEQTPRMLAPMRRSDEGDIWIAYQERTPVAPAIVESDLNINDYEPTVRFDPPEAEPYFSLDVPEQPAEPLTIEPEPVPEPVEKFTIKKVYPQGSSSKDQPDYFTVQVANEGETHLSQKMFQEDIPQDYRLAEEGRFTHLVQGTLFWTVRDLAPGDRREIRIERIPVVKAPPVELKREPVVQQQPRRSAPKFEPEPEPERPKLRVKVDQPGQVTEGEIVPIRFIVTNAGRARVHNVVLQTTLPDELEYPRGRQLTLNIPEIEPGASRSFRLTTTAVRTGKGAQITKVSGTDFALDVQSPIQVSSRTTKSNPATRRKTPVPAEPVYYVAPMPWYNPCCYQRVSTVWWAPRVW
ncbi:hypothetical protein Pla110_10460 [Polystyrenella longa]|uniref:Large cysteine-rich periplasmic protein OmcB n=1 Tax=Polystyrenella longa TaxID=2528007 RepID=A0A518CJD2_9PLAN|nr:DUF11 domain-containing protein [Polystyrenella longa]QDU79338.1 hypothetical protein Pla110_10460 [Polystyrenella longa]